MRTHLTAHFYGKTKTVPFSVITHFTADHKYVSAHYPGGELILSESLNSLAEEFAPYTIRVHRGALVKTHLMEALVADPKNHGGTVTLAGVTEPVRVSRRCLPAVRRAISERAA